MTTPEFFLTSGDHVDLGSVYACTRLARAAYKTRTDLLLIECTPPLPLGPNRTEVTVVAIAPRQPGQALWPSAQTPIHVHVLALVRPLPIEDGMILRDDDIGIIAWAAIYANRDDALKKLV